LEEPSTI